MHTFLVHAHSGLRWVVLAAMIYALISSFTGFSGGRSFDTQTRKAALYAMIFVHLQIIIGLILYFISPKVQWNAATMSDSVLRFFAVEHVVTMLIAAVLITIGYRKGRTGSGEASRHKAVFWFYLIGLVVLLAGIPWPFRGLGSWF